MPTTTPASSSSGALVPGLSDLGKLFAGGFAGLMVWEPWARFITAKVLGGPLEPAGLLISLVKTWVGFDLPRLPAEAMHYAIGIIGYPVAYYVISRLVPRWAVLLDWAVWLAFTMFAVLLWRKGGLTSAVAIFWAVVTLASATRILNPSRLVADCLSWGSFTWFNALGLMAPLAGLPFLLMEWGGGLSFMSYVGHVIYGFVAALVFELWRQR
jgi:hypothetical protein